MGLIQNYTQSRNRTTRSFGGLAIASVIFKGNSDESTIHSANWGGPRQYIGYPASASASYYSLPLKYGGIRSTIVCSANLTADIDGILNVLATLAGSSNIVADLTGRGMMLSLINDNAGTLTAEVYAQGALAAVIRIGSNPTAEQVAQAVWNELKDPYTTVDGSFGQHLEDALTRTDFVGLK